MSGALNSVFGGGNILNVAMSVASIAFPPLGIASSLANIAGGAIGQAVNMAAQQLVKECGMPKFLQDIIGKVVSDVIGKFCPPKNDECDKRCGSDKGVQDWRQNFIEDLMKSIVDRVKDEMKDDKKCGGGGKRAGSWLEALAIALGEVAGEKAAKMVELSDKITELAGAGEDDKAAAKESVTLQNQLNGVSKEFSQFMDTINSVVKGIGDGLAAVARRN